MGRERRWPPGQLILLSPVTLYYDVVAVVRTMEWASTANIGIKKGWLDGIVFPQANITRKV